VFSVLIFAFALCVCACMRSRLHSIKLYTVRKYFVVMRSVIITDKRIDARYDLKVRTPCTFCVNIIIICGAEH